MRPKVGTPPGWTLQGVLDELWEKKKKVPWIDPILDLVETGVLRNADDPLAEFSDGWSTFYIAEWVSKHPSCNFHSVDLNNDAIEIAHQFLVDKGLAKYCAFHCQDSLKYLSDLKWVDFAFLDSCDGLEHGVEEFRLAASAGASVVVMDDYQTKAAWAVKEAQKNGWRFVQLDRYSILRRGY